MALNFAGVYHSSICGHVQLSSIYRAICANSVASTCNQYDTLVSSDCSPPGIKHESRNATSSSRYALMRVAI